MWSMQKQQWQKLRCVHKSARYCEFIAYQIRYSLPKVQKLTINLTVASLNLFITYRGSIMSWVCLFYKVYSQQEIIKSRLNSYCWEKKKNKEVLYVLVTVRWDILYLISVSAVIAFASFMNRSWDAMPLTLLTNLSQQTEIKEFLSESFSLQCLLLMSHAPQTSLDVLDSPWSSSLMQRCCFRSHPCSTGSWLGRALADLPGRLPEFQSTAAQPWGKPGFSEPTKPCWAVSSLNDLILKIIQDNGSGFPQQKMLSWWKLAMCSSLGAGRALGFGQTEVIFMGFFLCWDYSNHVQSVEKMYQGSH